MTSPEAAPSVGPAARGPAVWSLVAALLGLHLALAWTGRMPGVLTGEDEATYLLLSEELRQLRYTNVFLVDQPIHSMYPPGYPATLALWSAVVGSRFDGLLLVGMVSSAGALLLTFVTVRRFWSTTIAFLVLAPLAVNPYLVSRAGVLASEAPYMLLTLVTLWGAARADRRSLVVAGTATVGAALTRSIGITLFLALAAQWLRGRKFGVAATLGGVAALTVGVWLAWTFTAPGKLVGASYAADFTQGGATQGPAVLGFFGLLGSRIASNVPTYLGITTPALLPLPAVPGTPLDNGLTALLTGAGLLAGLISLWHRWRVAALYLIATAVVLAIWPWHVERFVTPLLPLLVTAVVVGVGALVERRWPRWRLAAMGTVAGVLVLTGAALVTADLWAKAGCERGHSPPAPSCLSPDQISFFAALEQVNRELPADAILLATKRATAYYYTGRRQIQWQTAAAAGADNLVPFLREQGVGYVILGSLHWADLDHLPRVLQPNCAAFELVGTFPPRTYLLRLREPGGPDDGSACRALAEHRVKNLTRDFERDP